MCRRSAALLVLGLVGVAAVDGGSPGKLVRQAWGRGYRAEKSYNVGVKGEGDFTVVSPLDEAALGNSWLSRLDRKKRWVASGGLPRGHRLRTDKGEPLSGFKTPEVVMRGKTFLRWVQACNFLQQHAACRRGRSHGPYHTPVGSRMSVVSNV